MYYRPASRDDDTDYLFFKELRNISTSTTLVLVGHFSLPDVNWEHDTDGTNRSRRVLKHLDDNFLVWVLGEPAEKNACLDLFLVNREDLVSEVEMSGRLGHSNPEAIEFKISVVRRTSASKTSTLDMRRANLRLLRVLVSKMLWETTIEGAEVHQCWSVFKHHLLRAQEQALPKCCKSSRRDRRLAWLSRVLVGLR